MAMSFDFSHLPCSLYEDLSLTDLSETEFSDCF